MERDHPHRWKLDWRELEYVSAQRICCRSGRSFFIGLVIGQYDSEYRYDFFISKIDKDFVYYKVIFNGTPNAFLKKMTLMNYYFDTRNTFWILK